MTSSFLILLPDVPAEALSMESSRVYALDYSPYSAFYGQGYLCAKLETAANSVSLTFDLGTGNSRTIDHLVLGGVKSLLATNVSKAIIQGSNDSTTWANQLGTASSLSSRVKDGPRQDSIIFTQTKNDDLAGTLSAYRYFKFTMETSAGTSDFPLNKLYFGQAFDMGQEPSNYDLELVAERDADTWKYARGHTIMSKAFYPRHRLTVEWDGISDAKANEFLNKVLLNPWRNTVYLYTQNYKDPLYDNTLLFCRVISENCSIEKRNDVDDWNDIRIEFEEV